MSSNDNNTAGVGDITNTTGVDNTVQEEGHATSQNNNTAVVQEGHVAHLNNNTAVDQEFHAARQNNNTAVVDTTTKVRQARQNEKIKKQLEFFQDVTINDVTIDEENLIPLSANSTQQTMIQSIKGVDPKQIGANVLRQICVILKLQNYNGKNKSVTLDMIGQRKKNNIWN